MTVTRRARRVNGIASTFFVGRDRELQDAARLLQRARDGSGALALITGEAGVGKTELAAQVVELARADGFGVAWSVCSGSGTGPAFGAWRDLLRQLSATSPAARAAAADLVDIAVLLAPVTHLREAHQISATDRHALLESVVELLRIATRDQPIVGLRRPAGRRRVIGRHAPPRCRPAANAPTRDRRDVS